MSTRNRAHPEAGTRHSLLAGVGRTLAVLAAVVAGTLAAPHAQASHMLVSGALGSNLLRFDGETGNFTDKFSLPSNNGGTNFPEGTAIGADGNIYVRNAGSVLQFDGTTGAFLKVFVSGSGQSPDPMSFQGHFDPTTGALITTPIGVGLNGPTGLTFGPDGNLYVSGYGTVMRYNGQTGTPMGPFTSGGPVFTNASGVTFSPDGSLFFVATYPENTILEYNGTTGAFLGVFVPAGSLNHPLGLTFGPDGNLYVCSYGTNSVLRYNGSTGALLGAFTSGAGPSDLTGPAGLAFGPDGNVPGQIDLYVTGYQSNSVVRFNGTTGAFINDVVSPGANGLSGPFGVCFYLEAPVNLAATVQSQTEIDLSWTNISPDANGVEIDRKVGPNGAYSVRALLMGANISGYADHPLASNTNYIYRIRAVDITGPANQQLTLSSGFSSEAGGTTPPDLPAAPTGLTATANPGTPLQINLRWTNNSTTQTQVVLQRKANGGNYQTLVQLDGSLNNYQDSVGLTQSTTYTYRVQATNVTGASNWSNEASTTTPGPPTAPVGLVASATSGTQVTLTWVNSTTNQTSVEVDRKTGNGTYAPVATALPGNTASFNDSGLSPNTAYTYRVRASNSMGTSAFSAEASVTTQGPPSAPTGFTATATSGTQVVLNWTNSSPNQTQIDVLRKLPGGLYVPLATLPGSATSYTDNNLSPATTYVYIIRADNASGSSPWSNEPSVTTLGPPATPANFTATATSGTQVTLNWTNSSPNQTQIDLLRKLPGGLYVPLATLPGSATSYTDNNLSPNTTYVYIIRADNASGSSPWSNEPSVTTLGPPATPAGFTAQAVSSTQVALNWTNSSPNQTQIDLLRKLPGGLFVPLATLPGSATSYTDNNLSPSTTYIYIIRADNASGSSPWSNQPSVTTPGPSTPPATPTGFTATATSPTQVTLSWTNSGPNQTQIDLLRKLPGGLYVPLATLPGSATSYTDNNLSPATTYVYIIRADNAAGSSPWSNEPSVTTLGPPVTPTGFTVKAVSGTQVVLSWTNSSSNQTQIDLLRKLPGGLYVPLATLPGSATSYTDNNLSPNTTYVYIIRADNASGSSPWSNEPSVTTLGPSTPPATPTGFTAAAVSGTQVVLNWTNSSPNQTQIDVLRKLPGGLYVPLATLPGSATSYTDNNLSPATTYIYIIRADNAAGSSPWSNEPSVTTLATPAAPANLTATVGAGPQVSLSWSSSGTNVSAYALWRLDSSTNQWTRIAALAGTVTSYTDTTVGPNLTYSYHVRAINGAGASDWSNMVSTTTGGS